MADPTREWQMPGWRLVPVEPTEEMVAAWPNNRHGSGHEAAIYRAMLAAAPKAPPLPDEVAEIVRVLHGLHPRDDVNMQYMAPLFAWLSAQGLVSAKE